MKKIMMFLTSALFISPLYAKPVHCDPTFQGKPFIQVVIWSIDQFGPAECFYKNPSDHSPISYDLTGSYYRVSGYWRSDMPGYQWCATKDAGNQFDTCLVAKRETA